MPSILKVRVLGARNLPIMDVRTELTDAYVEVRFADFEVRKTATARRTLHPVWNEDFRFEVGDDSVIQNEPLELKVVDSDVITADDIIGVVFIDLNPLLTSAWDDSMAGSAAAHQAGTGAAQGQSGYAAGSATAGQISGWVPIVDTLLGVRGEINIQVRLQFFGDSNPFRDSSAGVQFFCSPSLIGSLPPGVSGSGSRGAPTGARRTLGRSGPEGDAGPGNGTLSRTGSETGVVSPSNSDDGFFVGQTIYGPGSYSYRVAQVLGFVELLDWNDDPEYHWADTFRTPRFSNESRQLLLFRLSGHIRRQLGKKVAAMGGNAVVGFRQYLDLEKDERIITYRAQGTAVVLVAAQPVIPVQLAPLRPGNNNGETGGATISQPSATKHARTTSVPSVKNGVLGMAELVPSEGRGNGGEQISGTPLPSKDRSLNRPPEKLKMPPFTEPTTVDDARSPGEVPLPTGSSSAPQILAPSGQLRPSTPVTAISNPPLAVSSAFRLPAPVNGGPSLFHPQKLRHFSSDQRLITTTRFPSFAVTSIGGLVTARSVKMIEADDDEDEVRDTWWNELRDEVENHARMLGCSFVLGYTETTTIDDDLYVLTASGTAANLDLSQLTSTEMDLDALGASSAYSGAPGLSSGIRSGSSSPVLEDAASLNTDRPNGSTYRRSSINGDSVVREATNASSSAFIRRRKQRRKKPCSICHISYDRHSTPFPMSFTKCGRCGRRYVPEMILATMEPPAELETLPDTVLIEAHVCRQKKRAERELNAEIVSDALPFVQYDIHRQLIYKLKIYGMNAIFGLKFQLSVGDSLIVATAVGTGMYLKALPLPAPLKIARNLGVLDEEDRKLLEIQDRIVQLSETNRRGIEAELQRSLAAAASARAARNLEAGDREATTGGIAHEDTATYDGTAESDSDSDSGSEGGTRRRRGSLGSDDEGDPRTVPVVQSSVIVQIDDDTDEDLMAVLLDRGFPDSFQLLSIDSLPSRFAHLKVTQNANMQLVVAVRQGTITLASHHPNRQLAALFREIYEELEFRLSYFQPCVLLGIEHDVQVVRDYEVWIRLTASAIGQAVHLPESRLASQQNLFLSTSNLLKSLPPIPKEEVDNMESSVESFGTPPNESRTTMSSLAADSSVDNAVDAALSDAAEDMAKFLGTHSGPKAPTQEQGPERAGPPTPLVPLGTLHGLEPHSNFDAVVPAISTISAPSHVRFVEVTPLSQIPGCTVTKYLGVLSFHFVKESYLDYDDVDLTKGMGGFAHGFLGEILAVARAHCAALGGNAVLTFRIDQAVFSENVKSTGYAVVTCSGDVVHVVPDWPGSLSTAGFREPLTGGLDLRFLSSGVAQAEQDPLMWTLDLRMALDP